MNTIIQIREIVGFRQDFSFSLGLKMIYGLDEIFILNKIY